MAAARKVSVDPGLSALGTEPHFGWHSGGDFTPYFNNTWCIVSEYFQPLHIFLQASFFSEIKNRVHEKAMQTSSEPAKLYSSRTAEVKHNAAVH